MRLAYLLIGLLLGYLFTPKFEMYEVTEVVWIHVDRTRLEMLDRLVCYMEVR